VLPTNGLQRSEGWVEHTLWERGAAGSNPVSPTPMPVLGKVRQSFLLRFVTIVLRRVLLLSSLKDNSNGNTR